MPIIAYFDLNLESFTSCDMVIETFIKAVSNPYIVFMLLFSFYNSLVDPTTRGLSDSKQAMEYNRPLKDYEKIDNSKYINKMKSVFLGVGHGGADSGAVANNLKEKDINLTITLACKEYLESQRIKGLKH